MFVLRIDVDSAGRVTVTPANTSVFRGAKFVVNTDAPYVGVCARIGMVSQSGNVALDSGECSCHKLAELPPGAPHLAAGLHRVGHDAGGDRGPGNDYTIVPIPHPPGKITPFSGTGDVHAGSGEGH